MAKRKTARINVHHVFGTRSTVCARVEYRGKLLYQFMANDTPQNLLDKARTWGAQSRFHSHHSVLWIIIKEQTK